MTTAESTDQLPEVSLPDQPFRLSATELSRVLQVDPHNGLDSGEAQARLGVFGPNELEIYRSRNLLLLFLDQFKSPLVWVLALVAALAFGFRETLEGISILIVIAFNALIGLLMEWQAGQSMKALRKLSPVFARVYRDGKLVLLEATQLVPGDMVYLEAGDMPAADMRILEATNLGTNEAALTGESTIVSKHAEPLPEKVALADQKNMLFRGTTVSRGNGTALVVYTGRQTQLGEIARLTQEADGEVTPLEKKLSVLSRRLIWLALGLAVLILIIGLFQGRGLFLMIEMAIALAIAAIPEGLPIVATIALAKGMLRLARQRVIVKKLRAVETLGETQLIITDKTGTLTENRLLPDTLCLESGTATFRFQGAALVLDDPEKGALLRSEAFTQLQRVAALCNNASLDKAGLGNHTGDPLEVALLQFVEASRYSADQLRANFPRLLEIPFDSDTKMMGTLHHNPLQADYLVCIKGALEVVLQESDFVLTADGKMPLDNAQRQYWIDKGNTLAAEGLRLLAFGYREVASPREDFFRHLIFIGMLGFLDPPAEEIRAAIAHCHSAGVKVVMATGDHPETAWNIGRKTGLCDPDQERILTGRDLGAIAQLSAEATAQVLNTSIFARVSPAQKLQLVHLFQQHGFIVGMTGDGVNDAPALKKADIGIAMGKRGTEAAKEAADLVLQDDKFSAIVAAIRQGRGIFENIRWFVIYLLSCNLSELLIVATAYLANLSLPLFPLQILFMNMVTDVFPALALGMNRVDEGVMNRRPRSKGEPIITNRNWHAIMVYALALTLATVGIFLLAIFYLKTGDQLANSMAFSTIILAQLWHVFNLPDRPRSFLKNTVTQNPYVWLALMGSVGLLALAYWAPPLAKVLHLQPLSWRLLGWVLAASWLPVLIIQLLKQFRVLAANR